MDKVYCEDCKHLGWEYGDDERVSICKLEEDKHDESQDSALRKGYTRRDIESKNGDNDCKDFERYVRKGFFEKYF